MAKAISISSQFMILFFTKKIALKLPEYIKILNKFKCRPNPRLVKRR